MTRATRPPQQRICPHGRALSSRPEPVYLVACTKCAEEEILRLRAKVQDQRNITDLWRELRCCCAACVAHRVKPAKKMPKALR